MSLNRTHRPRAAAVAGALLLGTLVAAGAGTSAAAAAAADTQPRPTVDVLVMVGQSAAMGDVQPLVRGALTELRDRVAADGLDPRIGIGAYGGAGDADTPVVLVAPTPSVAQASAAFDALVADGAVDRGLAAFSFALQRHIAHSDADALCVVAVNDAPVDEDAPGWDTLPALAYGTSAALFPIVSGDTEWGFYSSAARSSGGSMFDVDALRDAPAGVLGAVGDTCAAGVRERLAAAPTAPTEPAAPVGVWYLTEALSGNPRAGASFEYGPAPADVFLGDWDGDGVDTPGYRVGDTFHLRNAPGGGTADVVFRFGRDTDEVVIGDWDGDGRDSVGVRRGNQFFLTDSLVGGPHEVMFWYGRPGEEVLVGDWDGDGRDTLAIRRSNSFHVANSLKSGGADVVFYYGRPGEEVLVGDWDGDGRDTVAIRRGTQVHVRNTLTTGNATRVTNFGRAGDRVLVGDVAGFGTDTLGVWEAASRG